MHTTRYETYDTYSTLHTHSILYNNLSGEKYVNNSGETHSGCSINTYGKLLTAPLRVCYTNGALFGVY